MTSILIQASLHIFFQIQSLSVQVSIMTKLEQMAFIRSALMLRDMSYYSRTSKGKKSRDYFLPAVINETSCVYFAQVNF
jgi:hypothetical protein